MYGFKRKSFVMVVIFLRFGNLKRDLGFVEKTFS